MKSRKLWVTIVAGVLVTVGQNFGIDLDPEQLIALGVLVVGYVTGQTVIDKQKVASEVQERVPGLIQALNDSLARIQALEDQGSEGEAIDPLTEPYL